MKRTIALILVCLMLCGCTDTTIAEVTTVPHEPFHPEETAAPTAPEPFPALDYVSRFDSITTVTLSDDGIAVQGAEDAVSLSHDIIYYEDRDTYESGNPYGEGTAHDKHSAQEAAAHTVITLTQPGAYLVTGSLSAGQIRVDLGEDAFDDPNAVVELILQGADITCTVAPAILFLNTYECDSDWSADSASPQVDTAAAGANLILQGSNAVSGSHVAKIFKDMDGEKKLWKQDGAIYSYMSLNVFGPGSLDLTADSEGLDTELHLTVHSGDITIRSDNDGINTNEDGVSVTTINGGTLRIHAGLGDEGDGIDSNGYLVINGGTVIATANPKADAGMDSDLGTFVNGGTVIALGSAMDGAERNSRQVAMNLRFSEQQALNSTILLTKEDGTELLSFDPASDPFFDGMERTYSGAILSCPDFQQGDTCLMYLNGVQVSQTAAGFGRGDRGGHGGKGGRKPDGNPNETRPTLPEGETRPERPRGEGRPHSSAGGPPQAGRPSGTAPESTPSPLFLLADTVNTFLVITAES